MAVALENKPAQAQQTSQSTKPVYGQKSAAAAAVTKPHITDTVSLALYHPLDVSIRGCLLTLCFNSL